MGRKFIVLGFLALLFLVSGCIKINVDQKLSSNGELETKMTVDYSQLAQSLPPGQDPQDGGLSDFCDQQREQFEERENLLSFDCESPEEFKSVVTVKEKLDPPIFTKQEGLLSAKYKFDLGKYQELSDKNAGGEELSPGQPSSLNELTEGQVQQLALAGFEITYTVEMPGNITKTSIGKIQGNKVVISLAELSKLNDPNTEKIIESEQTSLGIIVGIIMALLLTLMIGGVLLYFFVFRKKPATQMQNLHPSTKRYQTVFNQPPKPRQQVQTQAPPQPPPKPRQPVQPQPSVQQQIPSAPQVLQPAPSKQFPQADSGGIVPRRYRYAEKKQVPPQTPIQTETKLFSLSELSSRVKKSQEKPSLLQQQSAKEEPFVIQKPVQPPKPLQPQKPVAEQKPLIKQESPPMQQTPLPPETKKVLSIFSPTEQEDVKKLLEVLEPEKQNFSKEQIKKVITEKGYSEAIAEEVIRRMFG